MIHAATFAASLRVQACAMLDVAPTTLRTLWGQPCSSRGASVRAAGSTEEQRVAWRSKRCQLFHKVDIDVEQERLGQDARCRVDLKLPRRLRGGDRTDEPKVSAFT